VPDAGPDIPAPQFLLLVDAAQISKFLAHAVGRTIRVVFFSGLLMEKVAHFDIFFSGRRIPLGNGIHFPISPLERKIW